MNSKTYSALFILFILTGWVMLSDGFSVELSDEPADSPCQRPLTYHLGDIDSRFDITPEEVARIMDEVEQLWESAADRDLINLSSDGQVTLNLVYSKEQKRTDAERQFSERIKAKEQQNETTEHKYMRLSERYEKEEQEVQQTLDEYNRKVSTYNQLAKEWDGKEPSSNIIAKFKTLAREINTLQTSLQRKKKKLESLREKTNRTAEQLNQLVRDYNELTEEYNRRFSSPKKFDQGRFIKQGANQEINIYQFGNEAQLKTVLAHEVGHALGLNHVSNPKSIMNQMMAKQNMTYLQLTEQDVAAIKQRCNQ